MIGSELKAWRKRNGYSQEHLKAELQLGSRGTISAWENSTKPLDRTVELALIALERLPELRRYFGQLEAGTVYLNTRRKSRLIAPSRADKIAK